MIMAFKIEMEDNGLNIWRKILVLCEDFDHEDIVVTFKGDGDKGQIKTTDFQFCNSIGVFDVEEFCTDSCTRIIKQKELTFADALKIVTYEILINNFYKWECSNSNTGTITYDTATGLIECEFSRVKTSTGTCDLAEIKKQV
jgi:hypothetical protein